VEFVGPVGVVDFEEQLRSDVRRAGDAPVRAEDETGQEQGAEALEVGEVVRGVRHDPGPPGEVTAAVFQSHHGVDVRSEFADGVDRERLSRHRGEVIEEDRQVGRVRDTSVVVVESGLIRFEEVRRDGDEEVGADGLRPLRPLDGLQRAAGPDAGVDRDRAVSLIDDDGRYPFEFVGVQVRQFADGRAGKETVNACFDQKVDVVAESLFGDATVLVERRQEWGYNPSYVRHSADLPRPGRRQ